MDEIKVNDSVEEFEPTAHGQAPRRGGVMGINKEEGWILVSVDKVYTVIKGEEKRDYGSYTVRTDPKLWRKVHFPKEDHEAIYKPGVSDPDNPEVFRIECCAVAVDPIPKGACVDIVHYKNGKCEVRLNDEEISVTVIDKDKGGGI